MSGNFRYGGYAGKFLRVNLTTGDIKDEPLPVEWAERYLGGLGLAARLLYDEIPRGVDPFDEGNKVAIFTGPCEGTYVPTASRIGVYTKSPLTGAFFHSSAGGHFAPELKYAGWDGILIEGKAERPVYIWIQDERVEIRDASAYWGLETFPAQEKLREDLGCPEAQVGCIGPAGEKKVRFAATIFGVRAAGRGGGGAVIGSKNLKAIAVRGTGAIAVPDTEELNRVLKDLYERVTSHPVTGKGLPTYGTPAIVMTNNKMGILGTRNWQTEYFPEAEKIGAEHFKETIWRKHKGCFACPVYCGKYSVVREGPLKGTVVEGPEYEDLFSLGSLCGVSEIRAVARGERRCDDLGLDAIEAGVVVAFAMEAYERGILSEEAAGGLELRFGNWEAMLELIELMGRREGLGAMLADGLVPAADCLGGGAHDFAMHHRGLGMAGHTSRGLPGMALGYATGPRGGSHHDGKGPYTAGLNNLMAITDSMIICHMTEPIYGPIAPNDMVPAVINAVTGMKLSMDEANETADRIWTLTRCHLMREGYRRKDDTL
ncbi:MAG: aldehyde ferredoxin oxidoreductase family protein, partial [Nitrospinota bacterium]